jgi:threonine dehydrogenase-like Zn-dependent dehydrogenase
MDAIVNTAPGEVSFRRVARPDPGAGQVRIRTAACGVCATDLEMIAGWERTGCPAIPGHEWAGRVDAVGAGVDTGLRGQPVVGENIRDDGGEVGFEHPGGYGAYFLTDAVNLRRLPMGFPLVTAALIEPLAVAVRGLHRLRLDAPAPTLLFGDGPLGLIFVMLLRQCGVEEIALVGGRPERLALARDLGATTTVNYHDLDGAASTLRDRLGGSGYPYLVEVSGNRQALAQALELAPPQARVLVLGDYGNGRAEFPWNRLLHRELELIGSNASAGAWDEAVWRATADDLPLERLVSHRLPPDRYDEALRLTASRDSGAVKVVLEWPDADGTG